MIINTEDSSDIKKGPIPSSATSNAPTESEATVVDDPPPIYTPESSSSSSRYPSSNSKPTNFVSIYRINGSVKGEWVIDPSIILPPPLLPTLQPDETEETRRNVFLRSNNGAVSAHVIISPRLAEEKTKPKVLMFARSSNGSVTFNLHDSSQSSEGLGRRPVKLDVFTSNGAINVQIPRSFHGTIVSHTHNGSTKFSDEVRSQLQHHKQEDRGVVRTFLGDFNTADWTDGNTWHGDELLMEARNGSINVQYDDEASLADKGKGTGFFSKLFGRS